MSTRTVRCPKCDAVANIPAAMVNFRCGTCGHVWNVGQSSAQPSSVTPAGGGVKRVPDAADQLAGPDESATAKSSSNTSAAVAMIAFVLVGMAVMGVLGVLVLDIMDSPGSEDGTAANQTSSSISTEETIKPRDPEPYREVRLPEDQRKRVYGQTREVARTTVEKPLPLPQGNARKMMEDTLQKIFDRELNALAALHNVTYEDVLEIIKEGDAKNWDPSPRSNAVRDGKRVYPPERSQGYKPKSGIR